MTLGETIALWIVTLVIFGGLVVGLPVLILWLRDRWWDRRGVSQAKRDEYQRRLDRGAELIFRPVEILLELFGVGILAELMLAVYGVKLGFLVTGVACLLLDRVIWKKRRRARSAERNPAGGAPPPIE